MLLRVLALHVAAAGHRRTLRELRRCGETLLISLETLEKGVCGCVGSGPTFEDVDVRTPLEEKKGTHSPNPPFVGRCK